MKMKLNVLAAILMLSGVAVADDESPVAEVYGEQVTVGDLALPPKMVEQSRSSMMIAAWKFNQGLYRKYGGRVVFQQAGYEPLDGHKAFMEGLKTSGAYTIIDPAYQDLFKETDEYFTKHHEFVEQADADEYFSSPWWLKQDAK